MNYLKDKWYLDKTNNLEEQEIIYNWMRNTQINGDHWNLHSSEIYSVHFQGNTHKKRTDGYKNIQDGYTLISFDEFISYVVNKKNSINEDYNFIIPILERLNIK
tara:strand:- start:1 stop:312 length:312 start_codon:yes stop_codon:yes gene_type:complete